MKIAIIVQARMGSTRLPGKVLNRVKGKPLLVYLLERLQRVKGTSVLVVATSALPKDRPIVELVQQMGFLCFTGSEEDVLDRYYAVATAIKADVIVRITADCPLMDPALVDQAIEAFIDASPRVDYISNVFPQRIYPRGMDVEVFSYQALKAAAQNALQPAEREHVTLPIYRHPERFRIGEIAGMPQGTEWRLTVDTPEDFQLISLVLEALSSKIPNFSLSDILNLLRQHPEWKKINGHIEQRPL